MISGVSRTITPDAPKPKEKVRQSAPREFFIELQSNPAHEAQSSKLKAQELIMITVVTP